MHSVFKPRSAVVFASVLLLAATGAQADDDDGRPSYDYVDLAYVYATADISSATLRPNRTEFDTYLPYGFELEGSTVLFDQLLLRGTVYDGEGEWKNTADVESTSVLASAGWLIPTSDGTGIDLSAVYRWDRLGFGDTNTYTSGAGINFGVRAKPTDHIELGLRAGWYEGDYDGAIGFDLSLGWNFTDNLGVFVNWDRLEIEAESSTTDYTLNRYGLSARYNF